MNSTTPLLHVLLFSNWLVLLLLSVISSRAVEAKTNDDEETILLSEAPPSAAAVCRQDFEWKQHPVLCHVLEHLQSDETAVLSSLTDMAASAGWLVDLRRPSEKVSTTTTSTTLRHHRRVDTSSSTSTNTASNNKQLPVVLAHGMGDSCFNEGMQHVTQLVSEWLGDDVYTTCIPIGSSQSEDTKNGYFLNMDASVDVFAAAVQADPKLANGFHGIGFSQGNNILRGYIAKYNQAPRTVHTFISVNGVNAGEGAVPYCRPELLHAPLLTAPASLLSFSMCDLLMEQASHAAYTEFAQQHSFQANYWRDPRPVAADLYHEYAQLAVWNNEVPDDGTPLNETLRSNYAKTQSFVWVMATEDKMVWPAEGEHWGAPDPNNPFEHILPMKETAWYKDDLFGLRTADEAGKNHFESFVGDHLQFTRDDLQRWVQTHLKQ